jgi:hypothetical protein
MLFDLLVSIYEWLRDKSRFWMSNLYIDIYMYVYGQIERSTLMWSGLLKDDNDTRWYLIWDICFVFVFFCASNNKK